MRIKAWAVIWKGDKSRVVSSDDISTKLVVDYPLFEKKKDAEEFRNKQAGWEVIPVTLSL
jgi:hypothetical protein